MSKKDRQNRKIDFNMIVRNSLGEPFNLGLVGRDLRLGKVVIDALSQAGGESAEDKIRCDQLTDLIVNKDWLKKEGTIEAAPFTVLEIPPKVQDIILKAVGDSKFFTGIYAFVRKTIVDDDPVSPFEGVELVSSPTMDQVERPDGRIADEIPKEDDDPDES